MQRSHGVPTWSLKAHHPLRVALARGLDLILPPTGFDGGPRPMTPGFSAEAWSRIAFLDTPVCDGCGLPFPYDLGEGARCAACMARPRAFGRARAACLYDEQSRDLILQLKHADRPDLGRLFALWLARAGAELIAEADGVVPVPMHRRRLFARRYNQAAEIARPLARLGRRPYLPGVLVRRRATASQGGKSGRGRRENVRAAFAVPQSQIARIQDARLVLVDDVLTTGATAEACAKALLTAGARSVDLLAVARVREASGELI
jgi:ComF family protein